MEEEAELVIKEISSMVNFIGLSSKLPRSKTIVFLNIRLRENKDFTVELTPSGFRV